MSLLVFAAVASAAAAAAFVTRSWRRVGTLVGFAGLLLALWAALAIEVGDRFEAAGSAIEATAYGRLFVLAGLATATLVLVAARLTAWQRNAPAAVLGGAVSLALGLASPNVAIGLLAVGGAALVATLVALVAPLTPWRVRVLAREVRGAAVGLLLCLIAVSLVPGSERAVPVGGVVTGFALVVAVTAVAHRLAAVPFHARASRLAEAAPTLGLPLLLAWIPAAWAIVLLDWAGTAITPAVAGLGLERALVVVVAVATLVLGTVAALVQDEIEKVAAYTVVATGGLVVLGFAALDPGARDGLRAWLPAFIAFAAGLAGWTIAVRGAFGTGRMRDLAGWVRRAPVLAAALVGIVVAVVGWPGAATWEARTAVLKAIVGGPAPVLALLAGITPVLVLARLVLAGAARLGPAAIAATSERPRWGEAVLGPGSRPAHRATSPAFGGPAVASGPLTAGGDSPDGRKEGESSRTPGSTDEPAEGPADPVDEAPAADHGADPSSPEGEGPAAAEERPAGSPAADPPATVDEAGVAPDEPRGEPPDADPAGLGDEPPAGPDLPWRGRAGLVSGAHRVRGRRLILPALWPRVPGHQPGPRTGEGRETAAGYLFDANRTPVRSAVVLLLAVTTLLAAAGAFGLREAAAGPAPQPIAAETSPQP